MSAKKSDKETFKLALVQMKVSERQSVNLDNAADAICEASSNGADIVCLPELFLYPYFCQTEDTANFDLAEPIPGAVTEKFCGIAKDRGVVLIIPLFEKRAQGVYHNTAVVIDGDGSITGIYRKMHIPDDPGFYEKFYFTPGDLGFKVHKTQLGRIATLICWDQWFPEAARIVALQGAGAIFYPTAIGWLPDEKDEFGEIQLDAWKTVQRGHAISNGVYVASVNRVGLETSGTGGIEFWGGSFVCDPQGVIIAEASNTDEGTIYADIDLGVVEEVRRNWPFLRDRRTDAYSGLELRLMDEEE